MDDRRLPGWARQVEAALVRLCATGLALTVAAQIMLTNSSWRPLLNFAHRSEGVKVDAAALTVIRMPGEGRAAVRRSAGRPATLTLRIEGDVAGAEAAVWAGSRYAGRLYMGRDDARTLDVELFDGEEITLRRLSRGPVRVTVARAGGGVDYPRVGSHFVVSGEVERVGPIAVR